MEVGKYVSSSRSMRTSTIFKGTRTFREITFNPSSAKPEACLRVEVPLMEGELLVPGTLALAFDMDIVLDPAEPNSTVNTYPVNNLAANILSRFVVKVGPNLSDIFDLSYAHLYNTYKDFWLTEKQRENSVFQGIQHEELRKIRADLQSSMTTNYNTLKSIFGKRYIIPLKFELINDHLPLYDFGEKIVFELTINTKENVLKYTKAETADFTLNNICLQFETLKNDVLKNEIERILIHGRSFLFDHVHHLKRRTILKSETTFNENVDVSRKSLKGILLMFQNENEKGKRDSEIFPNPEIETITFQSEKANEYYDKGYKTRHQWGEISKHFIPENFKTSQDIYMTMSKYYSENKFALWIDLRSTEDNNLHGTGKDHVSKNPITMEINKKNKGDGEYIMHIFIVSDAIVTIKNKTFC